MALTSLLRSSQGAKPLCQDLLYWPVVSVLVLESDWDWLAKTGEDASSLNHDDKKDAGWDAVAGKHPLENQRNSSRLGSAAPLRTGYSYGSKVSSMQSAAEHNLVWSSNEVWHLKYSWSVLMRQLRTKSSVFSYFVHTATESSWNEQKKLKTVWCEFCWEKSKRY